MAEIHIFPGEDSRYRRNIEKLLEEHLEIADPNVRECVKRRVSETLSKYNNAIPSLTFSVTLSASLTEKDTKLLAEALQIEYFSKVSEFARTLIAEICILHTKLCECEYGR